MEEDLGRLHDALRKMQKAIFALNTELREVFEVRGTLMELEEAHRYLNEILSSSPGLDGIVRDYVREQDLLVTFKETKARFDALHALFRRHERLLQEIEADLERYRNYRYYMFKEDDDVVRFLDLVLARGGELLVRPLILENVDVDAVAKTLKVERAGKFSLRVPAEKLADVLLYIMKRHPRAGFVVTGGGIKATWKPDVGTLRLEAEKEHILEADRIAQRLDATVLDI